MRAATALATLTSVARRGATSTGMAVWEREIDRAHDILAHLLRVVEDLRDVAAESDDMLGAVEGPLLDALDDLDDALG